MNVRQATHDDYDAIVEMTSDLWADRGGDYLPRVYHEWLEAGEQPKRTVVAERDDRVVGILQCVMVSADEAWLQGMRVAPDYRRQGVSQRLNERCFDWARDRGATIGRILVFSWNTAGLGTARGLGYDPITEFRWAHPPVPPAQAGAGTSASDGSTETAIDGPETHTVRPDPGAAWRYWTHSDARTHLDGLGFAPEETWALRELTRADFDRFAEETAVFAVDGPDGRCGAAYRTRTVERESDDDTTETIAEYGVGAWEGVDAARALFGAIGRDAVAIGADRSRVVIPETARAVSDAVAAGATIGDEPEFVLGIDLSVA